MRLENAHNRPSLLMLSDCFPNPSGDGRGARAWRLLCCAARTHEVYLSATADGPVNLRQWRDVAQRARRVHIAPGRRRWFSPPGLSSELKSMISKRPFDVLLATSPRAWPGRYTIDAGIKLCDVSRDTRALDLPPTRKQQRRLPTSWSARLRDLVRARPDAIALICDYLLVADTHQAQALKAQHVKTVVIPDTSAQTVWEALFAQTTDADPAVPTLTVLPMQPASYRHAA